LRSTSSLPEQGATISPSTPLPMKVSTMLSSFSAFSSELPNNTV